MVGNFITIKEEPHKVFYVLDKLKSREESYLTSDRWLVMETTLKVTYLHDSPKPYISTVINITVDNREVMLDHKTDTYRVIEWVEFGYILR